MVRERSLLQRLRNPGPDDGRGIYEDRARLVESVLANLRNILNSRHGFAMAQPDYGIPDLTDIVHTFPEGVGGMQRAIKEALEKYEPRLHRVIVKNAEAEDQLALKFEIHAELASEDGRTSIRFETRIDASGEVEIRE